MFIRFLLWAGKLRQETAWDNIYKITLHRFQNRVTCYITTIAAGTLMSGLSALSAKFVVEQWTFHQTADVVGEALMSRSLIVSLASGISWLFHQSGESRLIASQSRKDDCLALPTAVCIAPEELKEEDVEEDEISYTPYPGPPKSRYTTVARTKMPEPERRIVQLGTPRPPPTAMVKLPARQEMFGHGWNAPTKLDCVPLNNVHISADGKYLAWVKSVGFRRFLACDRNLLMWIGFVLAVQHPKTPHDLLHHGKWPMIYRNMKRNNHLLVLGNFRGTISFGFIGQPCEGSRVVCLHAYHAANRSDISAGVPTETNFLSDLSRTSTCGNLGRVPKLRLSLTNKQNSALFKGKRLLYNN